MRSTILATALCLFPVLANAGVFDGTWDTGSCTADFSDMRIEIGGDRIGFYESSCRLTNPTALRDMGNSTLYDLKCEGEGEVFDGGRLLLSITADGTLLSYRDGYATIRSKC